jgi:hypothetical protein
MSLAPEFRRDFLLGGDAKATFVSKKSGLHYTYVIRRKNLDDERFLHFVSVLNGPNNMQDFTFLGTIFGGEQYRHGGRSKVSPNAPSAKAFAWSWDNLESPEIEVLHSGKCSHCSQELTNPKSIARGLGPVCAEKIGEELHKPRTQERPQSPRPVQATSHREPEPPRHAENEPEQSTIEYDEGNDLFPAKPFTHWRK